MVELKENHDYDETHKSFNGSASSDFYNHIEIRQNPQDRDPDGNVIQNPETCPDEPESPLPEEEDDDDEDNEDDDEDEEEEEEEDDGYARSIEMKMKREKALLEFRCRVEDAILGNYLLGKPNKKLSSRESAKAKEELRHITLWGVPLMPSKGHEGTDIVLMKFLEARDFRVNDAFDMLLKTLKWRKEYKVDGILDEKLGSDFGNAVFLCSRDREGRPLCFNVYGAFRDKKLYNKTFRTEVKCREFVRWRVQVMEKSIRKLKFKNGGVDSMVQIIDLKNAPGQGMKELSLVNKKALTLFQNNYPNLIHKNIVVNVPFWFYTSHVLLSRFTSQKAKKKYVFVRPAKVTRKLLRFIAPECLPVEYGGLRRENDDEFSTADKASEVVMKANAVISIELPVKEVGITMLWDLTVVGWEVSYREEFVPDDEGSYKILLQNQNKMGASVRNSFYISEPGNIVITIENLTYKRKRVFYRSKAKSTLPPSTTSLNNI